MPNPPVATGQKRILCDIDAGLHRAIKIAAVEAGVSLNAVVRQTLTRASARSLEKAT